MLVRGGIVDERREKHENANAAVETLHARQTHDTERLEKVERNLEAPAAGHGIRAALFLVGAAACIVTEVTLSLSLTYHNSARNCRCRLAWGARLRNDNLDI